MYLEPVGCGGNCLTRKETEMYQLYWYPGNGGSKIVIKEGTKEECEEEKRRFDEWQTKKNHGLKEHNLEIQKGD
tara:strand:+ start:265 stop:486 length:222 start_codon:yes stop_codon:yes gene_type:complete